MVTRILRRRVIIREYDYHKVKANALCKSMALYDRAMFTPLNEEGLERIRLMEILKGKEGGPLLDIEPNETPRILMARLRDFLYDPRYYSWAVSRDEEGYLCVQARKNTPRSRLGLAVFEKDITARI